MVEVNIFKQEIITGKKLKEWEEEQRKNFCVGISKTIQVLISGSLRSHILHSFNFVAYLNSSSLYII